MVAALVVVVREDRASYDGEVGVRADEVVGKKVNEVEQVLEGVAVDVHRAVPRAHGDAVLIEVRIGGVLQTPTLADELDGDDAQVLARGVRATCGRRGAARVALVLYAELAGRVLFPVGGDGTGRRDPARVLLGLGEVDRDLQVTPLGRGLPLDVARDGGAAHVARVAAHLVEAVRCAPRVAGGQQGAESGGDLRGLGHERAHDAHGHAVTPARRVLLGARHHSDVPDGKKGRFEVEVAVGLGPSEHPASIRRGPLDAGALERRVVCPDAVLHADQAATDAVVDELLYALP